MKYFDNDKPYSVAEIRHQYKINQPPFSYEKWLELILSAKCVDYHLLSKNQKSNG